MRIQVGWTATIAGLDAASEKDRETFASNVDAVMRELIALHAQDPWVGLDMGGGTVEGSLIVEAESEIAALADAAVLLRTAVRAAGNGTPGWEQSLQNLRLIKTEEFASA